MCSLASHSEKLHGIGGRFDSTAPCARVRAVGTKASLGWPRDMFLIATTVAFSEDVHDGGANALGIVQSQRKRVD
jgi:hypothetical protein